MKQNCVQLFIGAIVLTSVAATAAGNSEDTMGNHVPQSSQAQPEQREAQQTTEHRQDWQNIRDDRSKQDTPDRLLEDDHDRLRELEQEIGEEQLRIPETH
jgi:Spy/CpxP family protein refolding chaperone